MDDFQLVTPGDFEAKLVKEYDQREKLAEYVKNSFYPKRFITGQFENTYFFTAFLKI